MVRLVVGSGDGSGKAGANRSAGSGDAFFAVGRIVGIFEGHAQMIPSPSIILGAILALILSCGGAFYGGYRHGYNVSEGNAAKIAVAIKQTQEAAALGTAAEIAKIKVVNQTIRQTLEKEIYEKPVYLDCRHSALGMQSVNAALTGSRSDHLKLPGIDAAAK